MHAEETIENTWHFKKSCNLTEILKTNPEKSAPTSERFFVNGEGVPLCAEENHNEKIEFSCDEFYSGKEEDENCDVDFEDEVYSCAKEITRDVYIAILDERMVPGMLRYSENTEKKIVERSLADVAEKLNIMVAKIENIGADGSSWTSVGCRSLNGINPAPPVISGLLKVLCKHCQISIEKMKNTNIRNTTFYNIFRMSRDGGGGDSNAFVAQENARHYLDLYIDHGTCFLSQKLLVMELISMISSFDQNANNNNALLLQYNALIFDKITIAESCTPEMYLEAAIDSFRFLERDDLPMRIVDAQLTCLRAELNHLSLNLKIPKGIHPTTTWRLGESIVKIIISVTIIFCFQKRHYCVAKNSNDPSTTTPAASASTTTMNTTKNTTASTPGNIVANTLRSIKDLLMESIGTEALFENSFIFNSTSRMKSHFKRLKKLPTDFNDREKSIIRGAYGMVDAFSKKNSNRDGDGDFVAAEFVDVLRICCEFAEEKLAESGFEPIDKNCRVTSGWKGTS